MIQQTAMKDKHEQTTNYGPKLGLHLTWDLQAGIVLDHQANCDSFLNGIG